MKKNYKISFLIAAHNEEKIIVKTLNNLLKLPYENYEVLIGLDGCTDSTEKIVLYFEKLSKKFRHFNLNLRSGKPAVIDKLIKESKGDIIIIQDSDWKFNFNNEFKLKEFLSVFDDPSVGGIAESFPVEMGKKKFSEYNFTYQMVLYSSFFWLKYQKNNLTKPWKKDIRKVNNPSMFLTNVFRKKLYKKNFTLGDDFERSVDIFNSGYSIVIFLDKKFPRMICTYNLIKFKDFFKQKIRTAIARKQLSNKRNFEINLINYYLPAIWFIFSRAWKKSFYIGFLITTWIILTLLADIISKFRKMDTKSGWKLRAER